MVEKWARLDWATWTDPMWCVWSNQGGTCNSWGRNSPEAMRWPWPGPTGGLGTLTKGCVDGDVDTVPAATAEGAGGERGGCKTTLKPRESPGGETGKSLLRSPDQCCFSLPNAVMIVHRDSLCMGTWEGVGSGPWWEKGREVELEGCFGKAMGPDTQPSTRWRRRENKAWETQEIVALIMDLPKVTRPLALLWTRASSPCVEMSRRRDRGDQ